VVFKQKNVGGNIHERGADVDEKVMEKEKDCLRIDGI
jgi:hypothetical protein